MLVPTNQNTNVTGNSLISLSEVSRMLIDLTRDRQQALLNYIMPFHLSFHLRIEAQVQIPIISIVATSYNYRQNPAHSCRFQVKSSRLQKNVECVWHPAYFLKSNHCGSGRATRDLGGLHALTDINDIDRKVPL